MFWRWLFVVVVAAVLLLLAVGETVGAQSFRSGTDVTVPGSVTTNGALFVSGTTLTIDGHIKGSLFCGGQTVTIHSEVDGDVYCAGQTVTMDGTVHGSVHVAAQSVMISGKVDGDALVAGQGVTLAQQGSIGRDLIAGATDLTLNGKVGRDVIGGASLLSIDGTIGRNVSGQLASVTVQSGGIVKGDLRYTGQNDPTIEAGGTVVGAIHRSPPPAPAEPAPPTVLGYLLGFVYWLVTLMVFSLLLALIMPRAFDEAASAALRRPGLTALTGVIALIAWPIAIVVALLTVIGIPLAVALVFAGLLVMFLSTPFTAYFIGRLILLRSRGRFLPLLVMLVGIAVLVVLYAVPFVGPVVVGAAWLWGTGMIIRGGGLALGRPAYRLETAPVKATRGKK